MKLDVLAFGAHPDDVEFGCGGTLLKFISEGKKVGIIDLTEGELGTRGSVDIRYKESALAAEILGLSARENLQMQDGFLENSREYQERIIKIVRKYQPDLVFCNAWEDRHPDHQKGAKLVSDSCFLAGLPKLSTELGGVRQLSWRPKHIFHYIQWKDLTPDFVVDISSFMEKKVEVCAAYSSQIYNPDSKEPVTPTASKVFFDSIRYRAQELGRLSGVDFAEGFVSERLLCLKDFEAIIW